ncbi:hypothetical protein FRB99_000527 [Tulasnella sp. 403]|nr:hypothetical protein FRB99_000527 [Tulasnella sp. 403]
MFKPFLLALALLAAIVAAVPTVKNSALGRGARLMRRADDRALSTNAKRFKAGLPPLAPSKLYDRATRSGPLAPRQSPDPPVTAPFVVVRTDTNEVIGYYLVDLFGGTVTYNPSDHSIVMNNAAQYVGTQPQDPSKPDLKPGIASMVWVLPENGNGGGVQVNVWKIDYGTKRLAVTWQNTDHTSFTTDQFWYYWFDFTGMDSGDVAFTADIDKLKTDFASGQAHWIPV